MFSISLSCLLLLSCILLLLSFPSLSSPSVFSSALQVSVDVNLPALQLDHATVPGHSKPDSAGDDDSSAAELNDATESGNRRNNRNPRRNERKTAANRQPTRANRPAPAPAANRSPRPSAAAPRRGVPAAGRVTAPVRSTTARPQASSRTAGTTEPANGRGPVNPRSTGAARPTDRSRASADNWMSRSLDNAGTGVSMESRTSATRTNRNGDTLTVNNGIIRGTNGRVSREGGINYQSRNGRNSAAIARSRDGTIGATGSFDNGRGLNGQASGRIAPGRNGGQSFNGQLRYRSGSSGMAQTSANINGGFNRRNSDGVLNGNLHLDGTRSDGRGNSNSGRIDYSRTSGVSSLAASGEIVRRNDRGDTFRLNGGVNIAGGTGPASGVRLNGGAAYESRDRRQAASIQRDNDGRTTVNGRLAIGSGVAASGQLQIAPGASGSAVNGNVDLALNRRFSDNLSGNLNIQDRFRRAAGPNSRLENTLNVNGELRNNDRSDFLAAGLQRNPQGQTTWNAQGRLTREIGSGWRSTLDGTLARGVTGPLVHSQRLELNHGQNRFDIGRDRNNVVAGNAVYRTTGLGLDGHLQYNGNNGNLAFQGGANANWRLSDNWDASATGRFSTTGTYSAEFAAINRNGRGSVDASVSDRRFVVGGQIRTADNQVGANAHYQHDRVTGRSSLVGGFDARGQISDDVIGFANGQYGSDPSRRQLNLGFMDSTERNRVTLGLNPREASFGGQYQGDNGDSVDGSISRRWSDGRISGRVSANVRRPIGDSGYNGVLRGSYNTDRQGVFEGGIESQDGREFLGVGTNNDWAYVRGRYPLTDRVDINAGAAHNLENGQNYLGIATNLRF